MRSRDLHQISSAQGYERMANFLDERYMNSPVSTEVNNIVHGLSDVMSSSMTTVDDVRADTSVDWINDDNEAGNKDKLEKVGMKS